MRAAGFIVLVAGMVAAVPGFAAPDKVLSADGYGPIAIGMNTDHLKTALRERLPYSGGCTTFVSPTKDTAGISFTIDGGNLYRIDVDFVGTDPSPLEVKTAEGIGLTSSEEDLKKAYDGRYRVEANPLDPTWHTIYVDSPDHRRGMIFETNGKTVKSIRAGDYPGISDRLTCK